MNKTIQVKLKPNIPSYRTVGGIHLEEGKTYTVPYTLYGLISKVCDIVSDKFEFIKKQTLKILVPDSLSAAYMILTKIKSLGSNCGATNIRLTVQETVSMPRRSGTLYSAFPSLISTIRYIMLPEVETSPKGFLVNHLDFDYVLDPRVVVYGGESLEDWMPECETDFRMATTLRIPRAKTKDKKALYILPRNHDTELEYNRVWKPKDWAILIKKISRWANVKIVGLDCDRFYVNEILDEGNKLRGGIPNVDNLVSTTNRESTVSIRHLMKRLSGSMGLVSLRSGAAMLAANLGIQTAIIWPLGNSFPISARRSWMKHDKTYTPFDITDDIGHLSTELKKKFGGI